MTLQIKKSNYMRKTSFRRSSNKTGSYPKDFYTSRWLTFLDAVKRTEHRGTMLAHGSNLYLAVIVLGVSEWVSMCVCSVHVHKECPLSQALIKGIWTMIYKNRNRKIIISHRRDKNPSFKYHFCYCFELLSHVNTAKWVDTAVCDV